MFSPGSTRALPPTAATDPVWGVLRPRPNRRRPPKTADVCIVGGGISGVSTLHWCLARGLDAVLLERSHLAAGASGRNAGLLLCGVAENYARAVAIHGRPIAAEVWAFTAENHALTRELVVAADAGYARCGSWTLAADADEEASLEEAAALQGEDGLAAQWTRDLPAQLSHLRGGILNPDDGELDPVRLVATLAAPHRDRIHEGVEVTAVADAATEVVVVHSAGETSADQVVVAVNALTSALLPEVAIRPVRAQMLATVADETAQLGRPAYAGWGYRYWRQLGDRRVLAGGMRDRAVEEEVGTVCEPTERIQRHLDGELRDLGVRAPVSHRWAGTMGFTADGLPMVGRLATRPRVLLIGGHTGHGLGFAINAARRLAALMVDGEALPVWLDPSRGQLPETASGDHRSGQLPVVG